MRASASHAQVRSEHDRRGEQRGLAINPRLLEGRDLAREQRPRPASSPRRRLPSWPNRAAPLRQAGADHQALAERVADHHRLALTADPPPPSTFEPRHSECSPGAEEAGEEPVRASVNSPSLSSRIPKQELADRSLMRDLAITHGVDGRRSGGTGELVAVRAAPCAGGNRRRGAEPGRLRLTQALRPSSGMSTWQPARDAGQHGATVWPWSAWWDQPRASAYVRRDVVVATGPPGRGTPAAATSCLAKPPGRPDTRENGRFQAHRAAACRVVFGSRRRRQSYGLAACQDPVRDHEQHGMPTRAAGRSRAPARGTSRRGRSSTSMPEGLARDGDAQSRPGPPAAGQRAPARTCRVEDPVVAPQALRRLPPRSPALRRPPVRSARLRSGHGSGRITPLRARGPPVRRGQARTAATPRCCGAKRVDRSARRLAYSPGGAGRAPTRPSQAPLPVA